MDARHVIDEEICPNPRGQQTKRGRLKKKNTAARGVLQRLDRAITAMIARLGFHDNDGYSWGASVQTNKVRVNHTKCH